MINLFLSFERAWIWMNMIMAQINIKKKWKQPKNLHKKQYAIVHTFLWIVAEFLADLFCDLLEGFIVINIPYYLALNCTLHRNTSMYRKPRARSVASLYTTWNILQIQYSKGWMDLVCLHAITHFEYQVLCGIPSHCNSDTSMLDTQMLQHAFTCYSLPFLQGGLYWCSCKRANWSFSVYFHLWNPCVFSYVSYTSHTLSSPLSLSWTWTSAFSNWWLFVQILSAFSVFKFT